MSKDLIVASGSDALRCCADLALALLETPQSSISPRLAAMLPAAERALATVMEPASVEQMAVEVDNLLAWLETFGIAVRKTAVAPLTASYQNALATVPALLVTRAFERIRVQHTWPHRPPFPGEVKATITPELDRLWRIEMGLRRARMASVAEPTMPALPERMTEAQWKAGWASVKTAISSKSLSS